MTDCGYETIEAADGQEALEQFLAMRWPWFTGYPDAQA
ncbi:hypothetical protein AMCSP13_000699 [Streptococcus pneumoniae 2070335]|nr:hypothetical protein AMCSP13_000699 [Streptococcus pneumoniae 2070335]